MQLRSVFAPARSGVGAADALASMLGMAVPVAVGAALGYGRVGTVAALGGLALGGERRGASGREQIVGMGRAAAAGGAAVLVGSALSPHAAWGIPAVAAVAALIGGISRPLARETTRFILYAIIAANLGERGAHPLGAVSVFVAGAAWAAAVSLLVGRAFRWAGVAVSAAAPDGAGSAAGYSARQLLRRWKRSLARLAGWQYVLRIAICLAAAGCFDRLWPGHHGYWVSITVVIVVQRNLEAALPRALQRAGGTAVGVLLAAVVVLGPPPPWAAVLLIAAFAAARPVLMDANYAAYAAVMTPLVILLLDFGEGPSMAVVVDRLVATLAGCVVAVTLGYLGWGRLAPTGGRAATHVRDDIRIE
jgi:Fusaric acid resistance protein-like